MGRSRSGAMALALGLLLGLCAFQAAQSMVIGVDIGTEFFKVTLVKPGQPFSIVTNVHSKRKTETMVAFDNQERRFGSDAAELAARKPTTTFAQMTRILGRSYDHPVVQQVLQHEYYPWTTSKNEQRGTVVFKVKTGKVDSSYSVEELTAMIVGHIKDITDAYARVGSIRDCVVTVPSFWTQGERQSLLDSFEIAGLKVLSLIEENTAAALQLSLDMVGTELAEKNATKTVLFYNLGASAAQVSIVDYFPLVIKERGGKNSTVVGFEVKSKAWDQAVGGQFFDARLTEMIADEFNHQTKNAKTDIRTVPKAMAKIKKAAAKTKKVLSANQNIPVNIGSLHDDKDLHMMISRKMFEEKCDDLFQRALKPVQTALDRAGMTLKDIDAVELIGGSARVPKISSMLAESLPNIELGVHLNGDEAMCQGAAFHAANLSAAFRVRHVGMTDVNAFPVGVRLVDIPADKKEEDFSSLYLEEEVPEGVWTKSTALFKAGSKLGVRKVVAFQHQEDIICDLNYEKDENPLPEGTPSLLRSFAITGIKDFAAKAAEKRWESPKVHLSFYLDSSGMVSLAKAEMSAEDLTVQEEEKEKNATDTSSAGNSTANATESTKSEKDKKKKKVFREALTVRPLFSRLAVKPMSEEEKAASKEVLAELKKQDLLRKEREEARNALEAFLYSAKDKMDSNEEEIGVVSTEQQREKIKEQITFLEDWIYDEGENEEAAEYRKRLRSLSKDIDSIFDRLAEHKARPAVVESSKELISTTKKKVSRWEEEKPHITEEERKELLSLVSSFEEFLTKQLEEQEKKEPHEDPAFTKSQLVKRQKPIRSLLSKLEKKPTPKPTPKPASNESTANDTASGETETAEEKVETEETPVSGEKKEEVPEKVVEDEKEEL